MSSCDCVLNSAQYTVGRYCPHTQLNRAVQESWEFTQHSNNKTLLKHSIEHLNIQYKWTDTYWSRKKQHPINTEIIMHQNILECPKVSLCVFSSARCYCSHTQLHRAVQESPERKHLHLRVQPFLQEHFVSSWQHAAIGGRAVQHICHVSPVRIQPQSAGVLVSGLGIVAWPQMIPLW